MFAVFRDADLPVILHSDGNIKAILPDLVDIGLPCLNPVRLSRKVDRSHCARGAEWYKVTAPGGRPAGA